MKAAIRNYKKAAKALRTFQSEMLKNYQIKYSPNESEEVKTKRTTLQNHIHSSRKILDETLGADALGALYWEGKEF